MEEKNEAQHYEVTISNDRTDAWVKDLAGGGVGTAPLLRTPLDERMATVDDNQCDMPYITAIVSGLACLPLEFVMQGSPEALDTLSQALPVTETDEGTGRTYQVPLTEACKTYGEVAAMVGSLMDERDEGSEQEGPVSVDDAFTSFVEPFTTAARSEVDILLRGEKQRQAQGARGQGKGGQTPRAKRRTSCFRYDMQAQNGATLRLRGQHRQVREFYTLLEMPLEAFFDACVEIAPGKAMDKAQERATQAAAKQAGLDDNAPLRDNMAAALEHEATMPGSVESLLRPILVDALSLVAKSR
jgi:hypothetical protein